MEPISNSNTLSQESYRHSDPFIQTIYTRVNEAIKNPLDILGRDSDVFNHLKEGLQLRWRELVEKGVFTVNSTDEQARPYFVVLQGILEHVLSKECGRSLSFLKGVIHTPEPPTPFCTEGEVSKELVDQAIAENPLLSFTIQMRSFTLRKFLKQGGDLYIAYPKEGVLKKTKKQQDLFLLETYKFPAHCFNRPLELSSCPSELVGAFYVMKDTNEKMYAFAIQMSQAVHPLHQSHFGLWFGALEKNTPLHDRITKVVNNVLRYSEKPFALGL